MTQTKYIPPIKAILLTSSLLFMTACGNTLDRLSNVGNPPPLTSPENPLERADYKPVTSPMPTKATPVANANSLWTDGNKSFFKDQRAADVGDIITVLIDISDSASINNATTRSRSNSESADLSSFLGLQNSLGKILPEAVDPTNLVDGASSSGSSGTGAITRDETIELKVAAIISQILPNGNMVLQGRQEVRVNFEKRELYVAGIIRPEDVTSENSISYDKIAEARISYGGEGHISDVQQARYGQQIYDILFPF